MSTSALKTGTNLAPTNLVLFYGAVYSLEDWLQGAGRAGRCPGSQVSSFCPMLPTSLFNFTIQGLAILLSTPYAVSVARNFAQRDKKDPENAVRRIAEVMLLRSKLAHDPLGCYLIAYIR